MDLFPQGPYYPGKPALQGARDHPSNSLPPPQPPGRNPYPGAPGSLARVTTLKKKIVEAAKISIQEKADALFIRFVPFDLETAQWPEPAPTTDEKPKAGTFSHLWSSSKNAEGAEVSRFIVADYNFGFFDQDYVAYRELATEVMNKAGLHYEMGLEEVQNSVFRYFEARLQRKPKADVGLLDFVLSEATDAVDRFRVSLPLAGPQIFAPFNVGPVSFDIITEELLGQRSLHKKELVGKTAGSVEVEAVHGRAVNLGDKMICQALSLLRLFSYAAFSPRDTAQWVPLGHAQHRFTQAMTQRHGQKAFGGWSGHHHDLYHDIELRPKQLVWFKECGLEQLAELAFHKEPSPFQQTVLKTVNLYSKSTLRADCEEKILYMLASVESLLILGKSENLMDPLANRMAFLLERDPTARKKVITLVKNVYEVRSDFVHHGEEIPDASLQLLHQFMRAIWGTIMIVARLSKSFKTKESFIAKLNNLRLGADFPELLTAQEHLEQMEDKLSPRGS